MGGVITRLFLPSPSPPSSPSPSSPPHRHDKHRRWFRRPPSVHALTSASSSKSSVGSALAASNVVVTAVTSQSQSRTSSSNRLGTMRVGVGGIPLMGKMTTEESLQNGAATPNTHSPRTNAMVDVHMSSPSPIPHEEELDIHDSDVDITVRRPIPSIIPNTHNRSSTPSLLYPQDGKLISPLPPHHSTPSSPSMPNLRPPSSHTSSAYLTAGIMCSLNDGYYDEVERDQLERPKLTAQNDQWATNMNNHTNGNGTMSVGNGCKPPSPQIPSRSPLFPTPDLKPVTQWRKGDLLGFGAHGQVFLALNVENGQLIAVKEVPIMAGRSKRGDKILAALETEIALMSSLQHTNIVRYLGTQRSENTLNIFLEFVPGGSIASLLQHFGKFNEVLVRLYCRQILMGLEYLHSHQIIHRDIKGGNILVDNQSTIKLTDFGAATRLADLSDEGQNGGPLVNITPLQAATDGRDHDDDGYVGQRSLKGTMYWMAPEVIKQTGHGRQADIWSVGCTVIEMATGRPPWTEFTSPFAAMMHIAMSDELPSLPDELSAELRHFIMCCLQRDPKKRPNATKLLTHPFITGQLLFDMELGFGAGEVGEKGKEDIVDTAENAEGESNVVEVLSGKDLIVDVNAQPNRAASPSPKVFVKRENNVLRERSSIDLLVDPNAPLPTPSPPVVSPSSSSSVPSTSLQSPSSAMLHYRPHVIQSSNTSSHPRVGKVDRIESESRTNSVDSDQRYLHDDVRKRRSSADAEVYAPGRVIRVEESKTESRHHLNHSISSALAIHPHSSHPAFNLDLPLNFIGAYSSSPQSASRGADASQITSFLSESYQSKAFYDAFQDWKEEGERIVEKRRAKKGKKAMGENERNKQIRLRQNEMDVDEEGGENDGGGDRGRVLGEC